MKNNSIDIRKYSKDIKTLQLLSYPEKVLSLSKKEKQEIAEYITNSDYQFLLARAVDKDNYGIFNEEQIKIIKKKFILNANTNYVLKCIYLNPAIFDNDNLFDFAQRFFVSLENLEVASKFLNYLLLSKRINPTILSVFIGILDSEYIPSIAEQLLNSNLLDSEQVKYIEKLKISYEENMKRKTEKMFINMLENA